MRFGPSGDALAVCESVQVISFSVPNIGIDYGSTHGQVPISWKGAVTGKGCLPTQTSLIIEEVGEA
jgi:hypothetical protein